MIPTVRKAALTEALQALTRKILDEQKKAAAANKEKAVAAAVAAADAAAEAGAKFLVSKLDVGLDAKAIQVGGEGSMCSMHCCCCCLGRMRQLAAPAGRLWAQVPRSCMLAELQ